MRNLASWRERKVDIMWVLSKTTGCAKGLENCLRTVFTPRIVHLFSPFLCLTEVRRHVEKLEIAIENRGSAITDHRSLLILKHTPPSASGVAAPALHPSISDWLNPSPTRLHTQNQHRAQDVCPGATRSSRFQHRRAISCCYRRRRQFLMPMGQVQ